MKVDVAYKQYSVEAPLLLVFVLHAPFTRANEVPGESLLV